MSLTVLYEDYYFKLIRRKDFVLIRKNLPYEYHAHFKREDGARLIIKLFYKGLKPYEEYFIESMRRITTPEEFDSLREQSRKPQYKNNRRQ